MRIVCLSDTHSKHDRMTVPDGDLLIHAGDLTKRGTREQIADVDRWLAALPHRHKVVIAGNHDFGFEEDPDARRWITGATYLQDEECTVGGLRIWGSPWQPRFFDWAFNLDRGEPLRAVWAKIPDGIDILVTHGPPAGILDRCADGRRVGCEDLLAAVQRVRPRLHVFGHIHEAYGEIEVGGTRFVNACACTLSYVPTQPPIVVDLT
jgi:Icc-related predicted phosphoesterase